MIKEFLHKKLGWISCIENGWAIVKGVSDIVPPDESGGIFLAYHTKCRVCGKKYEFNCSACKHTYYDIGEPYFPAYMKGHRCYVEKCEVDGKFLEFLKRYKVL